MTDALAKSSGAAIKPLVALRTSKDIAPITKRGDIDAAIAAARTPAEFWRATGGIAPDSDAFMPPSVMQVRISLLLNAEQQADRETTPISPDLHPSKRG